MLRDSIVNYLHVLLKKKPKKERQLGNTNNIKVALPIDGQVASMGHPFLLA